MCAGLCGVSATRKKDGKGLGLKRNVVELAKGVA